jgi:hypothetical protein
MLGGAAAVRGAISLHIEGYNVKHRFNRRGADRREAKAEARRFLERHEQLTEKGQSARRLGEMICCRLALYENEDEHAESC